MQISNQMRTCPGESNPALLTLQCGPRKAQRISLKRLDETMPLGHPLLGPQITLSRTAKVNCWQSVKDIDFENVRDTFICRDWRGHRLRPSKALSETRFVDRAICTTEPTKTKKHSSPRFDLESSANLSDNLRNVRKVGNGHMQPK